MKHLTVALAALCLASPVAAQDSFTVTFDAGNYGTMIEGEITGTGYADYRLSAAGGQTMFAELEMAGTDGHGSVYFNILPPGSDDVAIFIGATEGRTAELTLPEDGTYTLRVYQMGNDRDAGATSAFRVDLSIQ